MSCTINEVFAPNGQRSELFQELRDNFGDDASALEVWAMTRTPAFFSSFGDWLDPNFKDTKGHLLDDNGEPKIENVMNPEYIEAEKFMKAAEAEAAEYNQSVSKIKKSLVKAKDILTRRVEELEGSDSPTGRHMHTVITELKNRINSLNWKQGALEFANTAKSNVIYASKIIESEIRKDNPDYKILHKYHKYLTAYDLLGDILLAIESNPNLSDAFTRTELDQIARIIKTKDIAKSRYTDKVMDRAVNTLHDLSHNLSKEELRNYLNKAPFDISFMERMAHFAGDSKDAVVGLTAKLIDQQQQKTHRADIERTKVLSEKLTAMEDERPGDKGNAESLYGPMILKNSKGEFMGRIITEKGNPKQYREFLSKYKNTKTFEFYEYFIEEYNSLNMQLPSYANMGDRLPSIMKSAWESLVTSESKVEQLGYQVNKKISSSNLDTETGQRLDDTNQIMDSVPVLFTQEYDTAIRDRLVKRLMKEGTEGLTEERAIELATEYAKKQMPKAMSYDLASSLQTFGHMAENYANMNEIIDVLETIKSSAYNRSIAHTDSKGNPIVSKFRDKDGKRLSDDTAQKSGAESNSYKMLESLLQLQVYGQKESDMGNFYIGNLNIDTRKLLKMMARYNSMRLMGVNMLAGSANLVMGETMQWADAFGGEYYNSKQYIRATGEYTRGIPGILGDIAERTPQSKIGLFQEKYNFLGDYFPEGVDSTDSNGLTRVWKNGSLHFISSMGEHMMQNRAAMAIFMGTDTYDVNGKKIGDLWEAHHAKDGKMSVDNIYIKNEAGDLKKYDKRLEEDMSRKVRALLRRMHGNYSSQTATEWQRNALLSLAGQFRKWIADGWRRRYASSYTNQFSEQEIEGTYRSTAKFIGGLINDLTALKIKTGMSWKDMSRHQKANVKRTITEVTIVTSLALMAAAVMGSLKDLDDPDGEDLALARALRFGVYLSNRSMQGILAFVSITDAWDILRSPMAMMSSIESVSQMMYYGLPWNWEERYDAGVHKGKTKLGVFTKKSIPIWHQINRVSDAGMKSTIQYFNY